MVPTQETISETSDTRATYARIDQQIETAVERTLGDLEDERRLRLDAAPTQNRHIVAS